MKKKYALAGLKITTYHEERENADTELQFFFWFSIVVLKCMFAGFVFTDSHPVWDPFLEPTLKYSPQLSTIFTLTGKCLLASLPRRVRQQSNFQTRVIRLLLPCVGGGRTISFSGGSTSAQNTWDIRFFLVIFNYHSHSPMIGGRTTRALVWVTQKSTGCLRKLSDGKLTWVPSVYKLHWVLVALSSCWIGCFDMASCLGSINIASSIRRQLPWVAITIGVLSGQITLGSFFGFFHIASCIEFHWNPRKFALKYQICHAKTPNATSCEKAPNAILL